LIYDPTDDESIEARDAFAERVRATFDGAVPFVQDDPTAFLDPTSPFLAGVAQWAVAPEDLASVVAFSMDERPILSSDQPDNAAIPSKMTLYLIPDSGCPLQYLTWGAIYAGTRWCFNNHALLGDDNREYKNANDGARKQSMIPKMRSSKSLPARDFRKEAPFIAPDAFVLYAKHAPNNKWQEEAVETFLENFSTYFDVSREQCVDQYPENVEPDYLSTLCMMQEVKQPYKEDADPAIVSYGAIYVPFDRLAEVLTWALANRGALASGYDVDIQLVPLNGSPSEDFTTKSMYAGTAWRSNEDAL
jgi:hypothetical protein